jgi:exonuclease VII small subunit
LVRERLQTIEGEEEEELEEIVDLMGQGNQELEEGLVQWG